MSRSPESSYSIDITVVGFLFTLVVFLILLFPVEVNGYSFKSQLTDRTAKRFHHWNAKKKEITGYTTLEYSVNHETGELLEKSRNLDKDLETYTEKTLWFDEKSGELIKYQEEDFRTDLKTLNIYKRNKILTQVWEKGKKREFKIKITPDLVPFEVLSFYLQSQVNELVKKKTIRFTLYLPVVAVELTNKGLPLSLSQLSMKASVKKKKTRETLFGKREVITVRVEPTSFFIQTLLGEKKSKFDFYFMNQQPYTLVQFKEGDTHTKMIEP